jgi:DNA-binding NtrC family response regulator
MRILVVDDDVGLLNALRVSLSSAGHVIAVAGDGRQALRLIESSLQVAEPYDLMVTDLRMPGLDGLEVIRVSRRLQPGLAAILMAAYGENSIQREAESLERCGYLEKPLSPEKLHSLIEELWAHKDCVGQGACSVTA